MRKLTVAERRRKSLADFSEIIGNHDAAKSLINRFYRLAGLSDRLVYLQNDENTCNSRRTAELEQLEQKKIKALKTALEPFGLTIQYFSWLPSITDGNGYIKYNAIYY